MKGDGGERLAGEVFVGDGFGGVEGFVVGVEGGVDGVGDDASGEWLAAGRVGGDAVLSWRRDADKEYGGGWKRSGAQHREIVGASGLDAGKVCGVG